MNREHKIGTSLAVAGVLTLPFFIGWLCLAWAFLPLMAGLCVAPILALASLWRRERYPALAEVPLVLYGLSLFFYAMPLAFG